MIHHFGVPLVAARQKTGFWPEYRKHSRGAPRCRRAGHVCVSGECDRLKDVRRESCRCAVWWNWGQSATLRAATCVNREETVELSTKHGAAIAEVGGMRDLEMPIQPHVWAKILSGRVRYQRDRWFRCFFQIVDSDVSFRSWNRKCTIAKTITRKVTSPDEEALFVCQLMFKYRFGVLCFWFPHAPWAPWLECLWQYCVQ